jgi:single-stranded DNA-binding protein
MSKLFRPKRPLCGQPLTLNVSGTTFCCRAELFDNSQSCPSTVGGDGSDRPLVLFSVIVALAPLSPNQSCNTNGSHSSKSSIHPHDTSYLADINCTSEKNDNNLHPRRIDATFTTIERIHRNLARLCMVLTREEMRCQYVTLQCQMLLSIRKEYEDELLLSSRGNSVNSIVEANHSNPVSQDDSGSNNTRRVSNTSNAGGTQMLPKDKRTLGQTTSGSSNAPEAKGAPGNYSSNSNKNGKEMSPHERRESIQQVIEMMFASPPPVSNHGNLARELAEVFHFLAKHDDPASPATASAILSRASGRDGVIYINRHVAVPLDSIDTLPTKIERNNQTAMRVHETNGDIVNPHETLLFPNSSPSEILRGIENVTLSCSVGSGISTTDISASVSMSHALRRMLAQMHPGKSLQEVALDSALSLNHGNYKASR